MSTHLHAHFHKISNILLKDKIKHIILTFLHTLTSYSRIWVVRMTADSRASRTVSEVSFTASALNFIKVHCASARASTKKLARKSYCICWSKHLYSQLCHKVLIRIGSQHKAEIGEDQGLGCKYKFRFSLRNFPNLISWFNHWRGPSVILADLCL